MKQYDFSSLSLSWETSLITTENFQFNLDAFPIKAYHYLLIPKTLVSCYSKLNPKFQKEFYEIFNYIRKKLNENLWWKTILFEHWESWSSINWWSCNNHAHLHILNTWKKFLNITADTILEKILQILNDSKWIKVKKDDIEEIWQKDLLIDIQNLKKIVWNKPYYQIWDENIFYIIKNWQNYNKSQLIREACAKSFYWEKAFYNWKTPEIFDYINTWNKSDIIEVLLNRLEVSKIIFN